MTTLAEFLESQDFFELMQAYRHRTPLDPPGVCAAFEAVKAAILANVKENGPSSPSGDRT